MFSAICSLVPISYFGLLQINLKLWFSCSGEHDVLCWS